MVIMIFRNCPPKRFLALRKWGFEIASTDCPNIQRLRNISGKFAIVVDNPELAARLEVANLTTKIEEFITWLEHQANSLAPLEAHTPTETKKPTAHDAPS